jgi:hypothetical protein
MTAKNTHASFIGYRGELMAELFLQELKPVSLLRSPGGSVGFDFLVTFSAKDGGVNSFAVEVRSSDRAIPSRFPVDARAFHRLVASNIPGFFLIADVKQNRMFFSWPDPRAAKTEAKVGTVRIPVTELTESNKKAFLLRLRSHNPSRSDAFA